MGTPVLGLKNDYADLDVVSAEELNRRADALEARLASRLAKSVGGGADVALSAAEAEAEVLELTGTLTANIAVIVPAWTGKRWLVRNGTTGAFTLTVRTAAGAGVTVGQGRRALVYGDGADVLRATLDTGSDGSMVVGGGAPIAQHLSAATTWDPPSLADGAVAATVVSVPGAVPGSIAGAGLSSLGGADVLLSAHVSAADQVRVVLQNRTGSALDLGSGTLRVGVWVY
ncbi:MAG: hypothetical protein ACK47B_22535 [Armatimonadota bacterium]